MAMIKNDVIKIKDIGRRILYIHCIRMRYIPFHEMPLQLNARTSQSKRDGNEGSANRMIVVT